MMPKKIPAFAYYRTSSATNVGAGKDSLPRQREAVTAFAAADGYRISAEYYDAAISGADPIDGRPDFAKMLAEIDRQGVRVILVENASRFARDLIVQLTGHDLLKARGVELIPVDAPDYFTHETPTAVMVRQVLGAISQFEKASLVEKLRGARERQKAAGRVKVEGRKSLAERNPEAVTMARRLHRKNPRSGQRRSLRTIAGLLADEGHTGS